MGEMKKKIQLVEGERKAIFEDAEREKQENREKIRSFWRAFMPKTIAPRSYERSSG